MLHRYLVLFQNEHILCPNEQPKCRLSCVLCRRSRSHSRAMGKKTNSKKKRGGSGGSKKSTERSRIASVGDQHHDQLGTKPYNFVSSAGPGCYIAHLPPTIATEDEAAAATASNDWLLDIEPFHPDDFDDDVK